MAISHEEKSWRFSIFLCKSESHSVFPIVSIPSLGSSRCPEGSSCRPLAHPRFCWARAERGFGHKRRREQPIFDADCFHPQIERGNPLKVEQRPHFRSCLLSRSRLGAPANPMKDPLSCDYEQKALSPPGLPSLLICRNWGRARCRPVLTPRSNSTTL